MSAVLAGVALGVAGSAHCLAMCGPLVTVIAPRGVRALWYHTGRGAVYILLGLLAGVAGAGMSAAGLGRWWTFSLAAVLVLQAASRIITVRMVDGPRFVARLTRWLSSAVRARAARHPGAGTFGAGAINGLLPCGLVYGATAASAGLGSISAAIVFMAGFAIGTSPALMAASASLDWMRSRVPSLNRLTPLLLVLLAVLLIVRGLHMPGYGHPHY